MTIRPGPSAMHRLPRKLPVFLTTAEKKRLLKELKGRTDFSALRDRAMIEVLLGTGIRLGRAGRARHG